MKLKSLNLAVLLSVVKGALLYCHDCYRYIKNIDK